MPESRILRTAETYPEYCRRARRNDLEPGPYRNWIVGMTAGTTEEFTAEVWDRPRFELVGKGSVWAHDFELYPEQQVPVGSGLVSTRNGMHLVGDARPDDDRGMFAARQR